MTLAEFIAVIKPQVDKGATAKVEAAMSSLGGRIQSFFGNIGLSIQKFISSTLGPLAIVMGAIDFGKQILQSALLGDALQKAGQSVQATAKEMQAMQWFAKEADVGANELDLSLRRLNIALSKAANGSAAFQNILPGTWWADQNGQTLSAYQAFRNLADMFQRMPNQADKARIATILLGKTGQPLLKAMNKGSEGIDYIAEKLGWYNLAVRDGGEESAKLDDSLKELNMAWEGLKQSVASGPFTRVLAWIVWRITEGIQAMSDAISISLVPKTNRARWAVVALAAAFSALLIPLISTFITRTLLAYALWAGMNGGGFIAFLASAVKGVFAFAAASWTAWLPWLVLPALLVLLGLAVESLFTFFRGGKSALGDLASYISTTWLGAMLDPIWHIWNVLEAVFKLLTNPLDPTQWGKFFDVILEQIRLMFKALTSLPLVGDVLKGMGSSLATVGRPGGQGTGTTSQAIVPSAAQLVRNGMGPALMTPAGGAGGVTQQSQVQITVNPSAGMDEKALAEHTAKVLKESQKAQLKEAYSNVGTGM